MIAATGCEETQACVTAATAVLEAAGCVVRAFVADGFGGRAMEWQIRDGLIAGVLDLTTTELAAELVGGEMSAGPDRLTAAGLKGIPQVISVGALDGVKFGLTESIPKKYAERRFLRQHPTFTLMRTTPEELDQIGKDIAQKASAAAGPTRILAPLRGVSALGREGQPFWWPEADAALFQSLRNWVYPSKLLVEYDLHVNDLAFAHAAANTLLNFLGLPVS
ncbi:MAG TPA: Tm-1-like ATP-binding domain-containing protein [Fimbriiglobus sp.]